MIPAQTYEQKEIERAVAAEREHWRELLEQQIKMGNEAAGAAVAAERERCAQIVFRLIEDGDEAEACAAAIRKGEPICSPAT